MSNFDYWWGFVMLFGLILFYVGAVLFINSLWLFGRISGREVGVINFFVGGLSLVIALFSILSAPTNPISVKSGALILLFSFTYLWVAANQVFSLDGKGLGWFCLFVGLSAGVVTIRSFADVSGLLGLWNAFSWGVWTLLWLGYFLLLALARDVQRPVAYLTLFCAIFTAWVPGMLILEQVMSA